MRETGAGCDHTLGTGGRAIGEIILVHVRVIPHIIILPAGGQQLSGTWLAALFETPLELKKILEFFASF